MSGEATILILLWILTLILFMRSIWKGHIRQRDTQLMWALVLTIGLSLSLWTTATEVWLNQWFGGQPVAQFVKYTGLILAVYVYTTLQRRSLDEAGSWLQRSLAPFMIAVGLAGLAWHIHQPIVAQADIDFLIAAVRDGVISLYIMLFGLPDLLVLFRREQVRVMKLKMIFLSGLKLAYLVKSVGAVLAARAAVRNVGDPEAILIAFDPAIYVGICAFLLVLVPYRWILGTLQVDRWYIYYRLRRLYQRLVPSTDEMRRFGWVGLRNLEQEIYRILIAILDYYPLSEDASLRRQIEGTVQETTHYDELVQEMVKIRS